VILGDSRSAALAAIKYLRSEALKPVLLTSILEGEASTVGTVLSSIVKEITTSGSPVPKSAALVSSGETVVTV
jgi:glycerate-2-kinase